MAAGVCVCVCVCVCVQASDVELRFFKTKSFSVFF